MFWKQLMILLLFIFTLSQVDSWGSNKIKLKDLDVLTLYNGRMTTSRRSYAVPQLKCVGGSTGCKEFVPQVVQCKNKGYDGYDVQWECKTDMDNAYRFGKIEVVCEGYDYPDDPYILVGSCGLEYTIDYTKEGLNRKSGNHHDYYGSSYEYNPSGKTSLLSNLVAIAIIALVIFAIYRTCLYQNEYSSTSGDYPDPHSRHSGSFGSGGYPSSAPPPPGFRPEYQSGDSCSGNNSGRSSGSGGGFWTGAATGGLLGYLFGSRGNSYGGYSGYGNSYGSGFSSHRQSPGRSSSYFQESFNNGGSTGTRSASGYGGTRRR